jgi:uroporphyrinogen-III decarboxylase
MGGIDERNTLLRGSPEDVRLQAADALRQTAGTRFLLSAGCSIDPAVPEANIQAALAAAAA